MDCYFNDKLNPFYKYNQPHSVKRINIKFKIRSLSQLKELSEFFIIELIGIVVEVIHKVLIDVRS